MPIPKQFRDELYPNLERIAAHYGTPFIIYHLEGIQEAHRRLTSALDCKNYFAVKATPNLSILESLYLAGSRFDCSSAPEISLARRAKATSNYEIMFTSNNTPAHYFERALSDNGCILNLDDINLIDKVPGKFPEMICFRYNPGERRTGNGFIGNPVEAKYGVTHGQIVEAYRRAIDKGAENFGIHTMIISNERNWEYMAETIRMLLLLCENIGNQLGIPFGFINIGGGFGIPYRPEDNEIDLDSLSQARKNLFADFKKQNGYEPLLFTESGRYITGPNGVLVTRAINRKDGYKKFVGVDASMQCLMRPAIYDAYHHIEVLGKNAGCPLEVVNVTGSLCENNDQFAKDRALPPIHCDYKNGDLLIIQDVGAHGYAMGFNYNGKLKPKELLLCYNGSVELIRREETEDDLFATFNYEQNILTL